MRPSSSDSPVSNFPVPKKVGGTRDALLDAAMETFARLGYDGASNRVLAQAAGVNQALIAYHFGSKEGLYLAVFDTIAERVGGRVADMVATLEQVLDSANPEDPESRCRAVDGIETMLRRHVRLLMDPGMESVATLLFREQIRASPAFDRLWQGAMGRLMGLLTRLVALADGAAAPDRSHRLRSLALYGQVYVFRAARASVIRHLDETPDEALVDEVGDMIGANVRALFR